MQSRSTLLPTLRPTPSYRSRVPGGLIADGILIGQKIRELEFATTIAADSSCESACALAWLAGNPRYMHTSSKVGFHAAYRIEDGQESGQANAIVGAYARDIGLSYPAIAFISKAPPSGMEYLTIAQAKELGIEVEPHGELERNTIVLVPPAREPDRIYPLVQTTKKSTFLTDRLPSISPERSPTLPKQCVSAGRWRQILTSSSLATTGVDELSAAFEESNAQCRGCSGDESATNLACEARNRLGSKLEELGLCYSNDRSSISRPAWGKCKEPNFAQNDAVPFVHLKDADIFGYDLPEMPIQSAGAVQCKNSCLARATCAAYTYNLKKRACHLKTGGTIIVYNAIAVSGYREALNKTLRWSPIRLFSRKDVPGNDYQQRSGLELLDCLKICDRDTRCQAFSYVSASNFCRLKTKSGGLVNRRGVVSGIKR